VNAASDAARPDLVLITLGADDVERSPVVRDCVENAFARSFGGESRGCTAANRGPTVAADVTAPEPALGPHLVVLAQAVRARGRAAGGVPAVALTLYHEPFAGGTHRCPDVALLDPAQVTHPRSLLAVLNRAIPSVLVGQPGVAVADPSRALVWPDGRSHRWCSSDPWASALSIFSATDPASLLSAAPFHPTVAGQARFAALVTPVVRRVLRR
jgi:hypothetical protein